MIKGSWGEEQIQSRRAEGERAALVISALEALPIEDRIQIDKLADQLVVGMHAIHPKMQFSRLMALETLWAVGRSLS